MKEQKELTEKEKMFIKEYLIDFNGTQAAIRAGFTKNLKSARTIAWRLLTNVDIQKVITKEIDTRMKHLDLSREYVLSGLKELVDRCMQRSPVMVRKGKGWVQATESVEHEDGTVTEEGVWRFDSKGVAAGLRMLGEHFALFKTVHSNDPDNPLPPGNTSNIIIIPANGREIKND